MLGAILWDRFVNVTTPPMAATFVLPCNVPLPALRVAVTTVVSLVRRVPNWHSLRITGSRANAAPAVALLDGCVETLNWLAAAALTTMFDEVALLKLPLLNKMVMVVAA